MEFAEARKGKGSQAMADNANPKYMTAAEDALLFRLKEKTSKTWAEIAAYFPNRKQASLQVRYYRAVKKRRDRKPGGNTNKPSVNRSSKSSRSNSSGRKSLSGSSGRSHLSRTAKDNSWPSRIDPLQDYKDSRGFGQSSEDKAILALAPSVNLRPILISSKNRKPIVGRAEDIRANITKKRTSTETERQKCKSKHKNLSDKGSDDVKAKSVNKRKAVDNNSRKDKKKRRVEANEVQVNNEGSLVSQSDKATETSRNTRSVTRKMAEKPTKSAPNYKAKKHDETAEEGVTDLKDDANKAKKASNRNPPYPGSCSTGWVPVPPLSPSDPRYPGIIPKVFVHPPPGRIIEYNTGSGSFRIRTRRPSDDLRVGSLVLSRGIPVYKRTDPRHEEYEGDKEKANTEAEKVAARYGESFKTTKTGIMSPIREKGSDEDTSSNDDEDE